MPGNRTVSPKIISSCITILFNRARSTSSLNSASVVQIFTNLQNFFFCHLQGD